MQDQQHNVPTVDLSPVESGMILKRFGKLAEEQPKMTYIEKMAKRWEPPAPGSVLEKMGLRRHNKPKRKKFMSPPTPLTTVGNVQPM